MAEDTTVPVIYPGDNITLPYGTAHDRIEYGYITPDGEEHWGWPWPSSVAPAWLIPSQLRSESGQELVQQTYADSVRQLGIVPEAEDKIVFIQRTQQVRYLASEPVEIPEDETGSGPTSPEGPEPEPLDPEPTSPEGPEPEPLDPPATDTVENVPIDEPTA